VLLSSGTNPYVEQGPLVPDVVTCDHDVDVNLPHVEFVTSAYVTRREAIPRVDSRGLL